MPAEGRPPRGTKLRIIVGVALFALTAAVAVAVGLDTSRDSGSARAVGPAGAGPTSQSIRSATTLEPGETPVVDGPSITIDALGLAAPLDAIRFHGSVLDPPADVARAGIWADGAALADDGLVPTVIAGHVSDNHDRPGEFKKLWDAEVGMVAVTVDSDGASRRWRVVGVRHTAKEALDRAEFLPGPERRLRLITCASRTTNGDRFHYTDNLIVDLAPA